MRSHTKDLRVTSHIFAMFEGYHFHLSKCIIKIFRGGEGVVDGEGGSSERCLKWGVVGH